jgi:hypothetical protein
VEYLSTLDSAETVHGGGCGRVGVIKASSEPDKNKKDIILRNNLSNSECRGLIPMFDIQIPPEPLAEHRAEIMSLQH